MASTRKTFAHLCNEELGFDPDAVPYRIDTTTTLTIPNLGERIESEKGAEKLAEDYKTVAVAIGEEFSEMCDPGREIIQSLLSSVLANAFRPRDKTPLKTSQHAYDSAYHSERLSVEAQERFMYLLAEHDGKHDTELLEAAKDAVSNLVISTTISIDPNSRNGNQVVIHIAADMNEKLDEFAGLPHVLQYLHHINVAYSTH